MVAASYTGGFYLIDNIDYLLSASIVACFPQLSFLVLPTGSCTYSNCKLMSLLGQESHFSPLILSRQVFKGGSLTFLLVIWANKNLYEFIPLCTTLYHFA